ncbi:hypothetical protein MBAV_000163 [Candidatus Magnetobacterium bavaricum]|uniref:Uncharacterized protein n=1 Tax=Candidatus Magnetobacterium bavaricum TaxID=29290 RepID=A0A0F3H3V5_9BACT|nr:hypothetical protein MBAV_000163 [Candidatus Magnetobacterium bavaricum]
MVGQCPNAACNQGAGQGIHGIPRYSVDYPRLRRVLIYKVHDMCLDVYLFPYLIKEV